MKNTILAIGLIAGGIWLYRKNKQKGIETPILSKVIK